MQGIANGRTNFALEKLHEHDPAHSAGRNETSKRFHGGHGLRLQTLPLPLPEHRILSERHQTEILGPEPVGPMPKAEAPHHRYSQSETSVKSRRSLTTRRQIRAEHPVHIDTRRR